ncbi:MAG: hypothetical protein IKD30_02290, partial [Peptococcaceae bacterium]|nr:hypothetical protein [Peptococcaceae bacterium]
MDTKLKSYKGAAGWGYGLLWVLLIASAVISGLLASITAAFLQIYRYNLDPDVQMGYYDENNQWVAYQSTWTGDVTDPGFVDSLTAVGLTTVGLAVFALVLLILAMVFTGRFGREEDGRIHLNWYDRIWSEIHIMSVFGFATGFCFLVVLMFELWAAEDWFKTFVSDYQDTELFGLPKFQFVKNWKYALIISTTMVILLIVMLGVRGKSILGIDFTGGTAITYSYGKKVDTSKLAAALKAAGYEQPQVTYKSNVAAENADDAEILQVLLLNGDEVKTPPAVGKLLDSKFPELKIKVASAHVQHLDGLIGKEFTKAALLAIVLALCGIAVYI